MATVQVLSRPFKWSRTKSAAAPVQSRVVPLPVMDQWRPIDQIRVLAFFIVRQTLDAELLQSSLNKLIRNHLPILSARIQPTGKDGFLQYHVPEMIPVDYTLFEWSAATVRSDINASLGSLSTAKSDGPIILGPQIPDLERQWTPSEWPVTRRQERPDSPLLLVHLTHYPNDATVIAMNLPHAVADMMGYASVVRAWLQVAAGEEPTPFLKLEPNRLDGPQDLPAADLRKKGQYRLMSKKDRFQVISGFIPELMAHPKEARHTIFFPSSTIEGLRERCNESLKTKYGVETPMLSNGDILSALLVKLANLHRTSPKMLNLSEAANLRGRHPALPMDKPYLHNAHTFLIARLPISRATPLEDIAYGRRQALVQALEPGNIDQSLAVTREMCHQGYPIHICEPFQVSHNITNWCRAWHDIDFSKVATTSEKATAATTEGSSSPKTLILGHGLERGMPHRYDSQILCKAEGGYWCDFGCSKKSMILLEELLQSDPQLEKI